MLKRGTLSASRCAFADLDRDAIKELCGGDAVKTSVVWAHMKRFRRGASPDGGARCRPLLVRHNFELLEVPS